SNGNVEYDEIGVGANNVIVLCKDNDEVNEQERDEEENCPDHGYGCCCCGRPNVRAILISSSKMLALLITDADTTCLGVFWTSFDKASDFSPIWQPASGRSFGGFTICRSS